MKIWLITDTHFNHTKLVDYGRPTGFEEKIKKHLFEKISSGDLLIHLGDICIGNDEESSNYFGQMPCKKWLLLGNHDHKSVSWYISHGWDFVGKTMSQKMFGKKILFSHMPQTIGLDNYDCNIHGHLHDNVHRFPEYAHVLTPKHFLLAMEHTNYEPVLLETFLQNKFDNNKTS